MRFFRERFLRKQIRLFREQGYLIFDSHVPEKMLAGALQDVAAFRAHPDLSKVSYLDEGRLQDAWRISENVKAIARFPYILDLLESLYGRRPRPFQTLNFPKGTEQDVHSDSIHFNSEPFGYMGGVWIALEDVGAEQGPLILYPGSHLLPEINFEDAGLEPDYASENFSKYLEYLQRTIASKHLAPKLALVKKGQGVIWSANLLHGGSPQKDKARTRHSQVTHYYFDGVKPWRPGLSKEKRCYFEPSWIV